MQKIVARLLFVVFFSVLSLSLTAQNTLEHYIHYWAYDQNMWGPDSAYDINIDYSFFDLNIDEEWGFTEITDIFGQEFGVGFVIGIEAILASSYTATGFETGSFDLDYPVKITLDFPIDDSFDYGGPATIHTWYDVEPGWALETYFPPVGVITLDLEYMINPYMDFIVCVFGCDTTHLIPASVVVPYHHDTLFHLDGNSDPNHAIYPCMENGEITMCDEYSDTIFVDDFFNLGMTAEVTLPYVETEDFIEPGTQCLIASGDSLYMNVQVDILQFIYAMASMIPEPEGPQIQQAIDTLNGHIELDYPTSLGNITAVIDYSLLQAYFDVYSYMHQDISFCPTIWANMAFPVEMPYEITDPNNGGALFEDGTNDSISVPVGHDLTIIYPCHGTEPYKDSMLVDVTYDITPTITNHTFDSIAFEITIEVLSVSITIELPFKKAIEPDTLPGFELPPIVAENNTKIYASAPSIHSPGVDISGTEKNAAKDLGPWEIGPLFEWIIPIGNTELDWFDETWEIPDLQQDTVIHDSTWIVPFDKSELNLNMYIEQGTFCYGDTVGYIFAQATDDLAPLTYYWSTGDVHSGIMNSLDSLNAEPGYYSVTATNDYGCTTEDDFTVDINPPIIHSLEGEDVLCHGMHTGTIVATTSGGTPPYFYDWSFGDNNDGLGEDTATNLPAGMHYVTISDWTGCSVVDSIFIDEPPTAIAADISATPVDCHSDENGSISIYPYDGTPPYSIEWEDSTLSGYDVENIPGGIYTVSITDANGCVLEEDIEVVQPDSLVADIADTDITCHGDADGQIGVYPEGGTPPYSYRWFHDLSIDTDTLSNLPPGYYFVSVTDSHGCVDTVSTYITEPDTLDLIVNTQNTSCQGLYDGWISITPQGGTPGYTIDWENHPEWHNVDSVHHLNAGNYEVSITDSHGCLYVENIEVTEPDNLAVQFTDINNISCYGFEDGSAIADVSGGTEPYEYTWTNGIDVNDSLAYNLIANQEYGVTITDANGCQVQNYITLSQPDSLEFENLSTTPVECGVSAGSGHVEGDGGSEPYTFEWSNGETGTDPVDLPFGTVIITLTDAHGCQDTISVEVDRVGDIDAQAAVINEIECYGDSTAVAFAELPDGFPPLSFFWYDEGNTMINDDDTISQIPAGTYYVYAHDVYYCSDTVELIIEQPDSIYPGIELIAPSCSAIPDGEILTDVSGGTSPYSYAWSTGSYDSEITGVRDGTYYLTITDFYDCTKIVHIELEEAEYCIIVHNTITPNGDGKNDTWVVENIEEFPYSEVWIYNRDGREIYYTEAYHNDWDGKYKGKKLPDGTYFYVIDLGKGKELIKGYITIIR